MNKFIRRLSRIIPDKPYICLQYFYHFHKFPNLKNPQTFNEKLQWLKLYDRKPEYTKMVDKVEAKKYVASLIGDEYIIPTLGVWERAEDIDFDSLPNQFVLKWNHDSGSIVICRDKSTFDKEAAIKKLSGGEKRNGFWYGREWPYKNVKPLVFAEQYMEDKETKELRDYKVFCFNGVAKTLFIATDRQTEGKLTTHDFYTVDFEHLPIRKGIHPNVPERIKQPKCLRKMLDISELVSKNIPHLRVDFYEVDGKIYFGELTFADGSGYEKFSPEQWDKTFGDWITLPDIIER